MICLPVNGLSPSQGLLSARCRACARQRGGTGSTCPSLQGRDCLPASRSRRERCSSFLPQGRRAPHPLQSGSGFHDLSRGGLPTPAPAGLPDFHPPALTFRANLFTLTPSSARRRHPEPSYWPLGYPTPPQNAKRPRGGFLRVCGGVQSILNLVATFRRRPVCWTAGETERFPPPGHCFSGHFTISSGGSILTKPYPERGHTASLPHSDRS